ncbi:MAG: phosphate ABC transporter permease subunit PstC [Methanothrix sp.]|jgi:phosphate ABC transporter permease protein PstC|uniref:Phosphate transport system permease protein n=1 Tax=Methanothrix harundinacea TaxID=301375 RepID=A0A101FV37_9EURY|nr:MAG: Phosphate ABC transporter, permease protein PstC [Methanothrix harundinacea]MDD2637521.1 phosphate ABC transporter permease subunit PstC [Methanothrix sp.]MDI9398845.1 phosphate ABC transporter permease subunit PstC [Euryarchaeota archaeon]KUK96283.1 MAG: Phosphate ABC transporter, permease protein PstC [Methanothrix harundinacea]MCP1391811.1 phosphate ABC transporter permease subunit PstC [Methanothrix harundinacea]
MDSPKKRKPINRRIREQIIEYSLFFTAITSILVMVLIFFFLIRESLAAFSVVGVSSLLFGMKWHSAGNTFGMAPIIVGSIMVTLLALVINIFVGVPLAIYLSELAGPRGRSILKPAIELLAGVPSIVYGFLGVLILVAYLEKSFDMLTGRSILAGAILLGIMFIPALTTICEDALRAVPKEFKEGSLALGATHWQTVRRVTLPAASSGIIAAVVLNVGNIIGETMAALLVVGNVARLPSPIFDIFDPSAIFTSVIAGEMGEVPHGSIHYHALFAVGFVLLAIVTVLNISADLVRDAIQKKFGRY